jgi:hypothetical protein
MFRQQMTIPRRGVPASLCNYIFTKLINPSKIAWMALGKFYDKKSFPLIYSQKSFFY